MTIDAAFEFCFFKTGDKYDTEYSYDIYVLVTKKKSVLLT